MIGITHAKHHIFLKTSSILKISGSIAFLALFFLRSAICFANQEATENDQDSLSQTIVIALDGAGTCFKNISGQIGPADISVATTMHKVVSQTKELGLAKNPHVLQACLALDTKSGAYGTDLGSPNVVENLPLDQLLGEIASRINELPKPRILLVGFSYGGWLALKLLPLFGSHAQLLGLLTIDSISIDQCPVVDWINGALNGESLPGCTQAPSDITPEELALASQKSGSWVNIYQDKGYYLHSGPFTGARNILKNDTDANPRTLWPHLVLTWDDKYTTSMAKDLVLAAKGS